MSLGAYFYLIKYRYLLQCSVLHLICFSQAVLLVSLETCENCVMQMIKQKVLRIHRPEQQVISLIIMKPSPPDWNHRMAQSNPGAIISRNANNADANTKVNQPCTAESHNKCYDSFTTRKMKMLFPHPAPLPLKHSL